MDDEALLIDLSERLRDAHQRVSALQIEAAEKSSVFRQLLAVSELSKRSTAKASKKLDAFVADLDARFGASH